MLKRLHLRNFTVFADAEFEFGEGLNVLVGTNGTGKTHVLKAGYVVLYNFLKRNQLFAKNSSNWGKPYEGPISRPYEVILDNKFKDVFRPSPLYTKELIRHNTELNEALVQETILSADAEVTSAIVLSNDLAVELPIQLPINSKASLDFIPPVFIPAKETLTLGWLPSLYGRFDIPFDETYPDLLRLLFGPPLRQPEPAHIVEKLAQLIGGKVEEEGGHFYLTAENKPRLEMNLVAEGMRKFATLYKLLANGTLTPETTLFWDEPEANLNPALLKELAIILTDLAQAGFQVILATHSLFLMKELHILSRQRKQPVRYFGLYAGEKGDVQVERQDDFMQLQHIAALDAELAQTFDFDEVLEQDYAGDS
ncbi:MAG: hypothetical protein EOO56_17975 [Hymenobacter sp.]|nr:MAG: hypothetical protein EOO56_17975 [Hymenobacter sp.]